MSVRQSAAIVVLTIATAVVYGIFHDEITARICVEYFTIGHPPVFGTDDPTLLGLGWGVIATWWVGLILGVLLALAAQVGGWPPVGVCNLYRPLVITLACVAVVAAAAGVVGHVAAAQGWVYLVGPIVERLPADRHVAFLTDLWTHMASYIGGGVGGLVLCAWVLVRRKHAADRAPT
jgi:hypothetical protein